MSIPTLVTFIVYFVFLLGIGFYFYRKNVSIEDYLLGGRGMGAWVTGTVVLVLWKQVGLSSRLYEIVPGFIANCLTIFSVNIIVGQKNQKVLTEYEEVIEAITTSKN